MAKSANGYCPEGECDCVEPCETTAEAFEHMMAEPIELADCCITRGKRGSCNQCGGPLGDAMDSNDHVCGVPRPTRARPIPANGDAPVMCPASTHFAGVKYACRLVKGHEGNHQNDGAGLGWFNTAELVEEPIAEWERQILESTPSVDMVNHPPHYSDCGQCRKCGSKVEVIQITEGMGFNLGNAVKYVLRCDKKHDAIEDLRKAVWYLEREIQRRERAS